MLTSIQVKQQFLYSTEMNIYKVNAYSTGTYISYVIHFTRFIILLKSLAGPKAQSP